MSLAKRLFSFPRIRATVATLLAGYIWLTQRLTRFAVIHPEIPEHFWEYGKPFILALWHGQIFLGPTTWRKGLPMNMLISQHRDGDLIARTIAYAGIGSIRGSASKPGSTREKGGAGALRALLSAIKRGESIGITPDGPRGPRMRASDGVITVARLSGVPIIPVAIVSNRRRILNTWDRFTINFPFARGAIVWGEPIYVERQADEAQRESLRLDLETSLNSVNAKAHEIIGCTGIAPERLSS